MFYYHISALICYAEIDVYHIISGLQSEKKIEYLAQQYTLDIEERGNMDLE